jgi:alkanesulfonate monooxygenase SsuD/methylene tetrahydromethanopterin reductase-like flavin-dependent oxidoreductase (luciferase family)
VPAGAGSPPPRSPPTDYRSGRGEDQQTRPEVLKPKIKKIRDIAERMGRDPPSLTKIPLLTVVTALTDAEAQAKYAAYRRPASGQAKRLRGTQPARPQGPVPEILRGEMRITKPAG